MVEFTLRNFDGRLYLKEELKQILDSREIRAVVQNCAVLLLPTTVTDEQALAALNLMRQELKLRGRVENNAEVIEE